MAELLDRVMASPSAAEKQTTTSTPEEKAPEVPLASFVKGGTPTTGSERLYEERFREGEKRRNEADVDKRIGTTPIEEGGGRLYANQFTGHPEIPKAYVLLTYVNEYGSKIPPGECLADVFQENWDRPDDWTLGIMCPKCWAAGVKHAQDCQLMIKMSNRTWVLQPGAGPKTFIFDDGAGPKSYNSAGIITESERFTCSDCDWAARIINNRIRTER